LDLHIPSPLAPWQTSETSGTLLSRLPSRSLPESVWGGFGAKSLYFERFVLAARQDNSPFFQPLFLHHHQAY